MWESIKLDFNEDSKPDLNLFIDWSYRKSEIKEVIKWAEHITNESTFNRDSLKDWINKDARAANESQLERKENISVLKDMLSYIKENFSNEYQKLIELKAIDANGNLVPRWIYWVAILQTTLNILWIEVWTVDKSFWKNTFYWLLKWQNNSDTYIEKWWKPDWIAWNKTLTAIFEELQTKAWIPNTLEEEHTKTIPEDITPNTPIEEPTEIRPSITDEDIVPSTPVEESTEIEASITDEDIVPSTPIEATIKTQDDWVYIETPTEKPTVIEEEEYFPIKDDWDSQVISYPEDLEPSIQVEETNVQPENFEPGIPIEITVEKQIEEERKATDPHTKRFPEDTIPNTPIEEPTKVEPPLL